MRVSAISAAKLFARLRKPLSAAFALGVLALAPAAVADDAARVLRIDHYVRVKSTAPSVAGQDVQLYVREVVLAGTALRGGAGPNGVVLFVHGAGTPAEVAFDPSYGDYSWMAYLAKAGFDVFSVDITGYGRSTRPPQMSDPCNLPAASQAQFVPALAPKACAPSYPRPITTMASDWNDIGAVVDHLRALRGVEKVSLVGWSQGGPRTLGYTSRNPGKVSRVVVLAPAYNRTGPTDPPNPLPGAAGPLTSQSEAEFIAQWNRQVGCPDQYDPAVRDAVWADLLASDPVGATWGPGVRRAPQVPTWGFNQSVVARMDTPVLMFAGLHDKQVPPDRVRDFYADLRSSRKVYAELACSSHNAMWEREHLALFRASAEWLREGQVNGQTQGVLKLSN